MVDTTLPPLIQALHRPACYGHPVQKIELVETHISWIFLTGTYAYKIKKPLNLGFLDFSSLDKRRFFCEAELRLNQRLAPSLYQAVVPIAGPPATPLLAGRGEVIEYAVKMIQFPAAARLDRMLARGELHPQHVRLLAQELAQFHDQIAVAGSDSAFGNPQQVHEPVRQNFEQLHARIDARDQGQLRRLRIWSELSFAELKQTFSQRKQRGYIRECHGDAHLANMIWRDDRVVLFDCLEFNENLRWIDTFSELAFVTMDLDDRAHPDLASHVLNGYLESSGDYAGLAVLRFYQVYRALVRAKVACIRAGQSGLSEAAKQQAREEYLGYTQLAERYTQPAPAALIITHGFSGSGKSWLSQLLLADLGAIRLRSDVERKRLHGLTPQAHSGSSIVGGIYTAAAGRQTYARLAQLAGEILRAGYTVIVDAACLMREQRAQLRAVAQQARAPFVILDVHASDHILRERLRLRARQHQDVSEADRTVFEHQRATHEPLDADESGHALLVDSGTSPDIPVLLRNLRALTLPNE